MTLYSPPWTHLHTLSFSCCSSLTKSFQKNWNFPPPVHLLVDSKKNIWLFSCYGLTQKYDKSLGIKMQWLYNQIRLHYILMNRRGLYIKWSLSGLLLFSSWLFCINMHGLAAGEPWLYASLYTRSHWGRACFHQTSWALNASPLL